MNDRVTEQQNRQLNPLRRLAIIELFDSMLIYDTWKDASPHWHENCTDGTFLNFDRKL